MRSIIILSLFILVSCSHGKHTVQSEVTIEVKKHYLIIDGQRYSDAEDLKKAIENPSNTTAHICADAVAPPSEVMAVLSKLRELGVEGKILMSTSFKDEPCQ